ncbi:hypothetical protein BS47DRAFT_1358940 [Hydnum rufescens UP504]|uniref:Uncharacterized protein n=1 Tax=Hydnum rufescens UP504 TaxID=1448309 RepID=A0A9P6B7L9_9AGAM|nr:hypothetical protein BS47DRAFT_1358940 [Hydnum rufescens UP504]
MQKEQQLLLFLRQPHMSPNPPTPQDPNKTLHATREEKKEPHPLQQVWQYQPQQNHGTTPKPHSHTKTMQPRQNHAATQKPHSHKHKPTAANATHKPQMMPCDGATNGTHAKGQPKVPAYPLQMYGLANDHMPTVADLAPPNPHEPLQTSTMHPLQQDPNQCSPNNDPPQWRPMTRPNDLPNSESPSPAPCTTHLP